MIMGDAILKRLRKNEGFTIVELLIALTLLVVAIVPMAVILETGLKTGVSTNTRMHAREVAASEIDKVKSLTFNAIGMQGADLTYDQAVSAQNSHVSIRPDIGTGLASTSTVTTSSGNTFTVTRDVRVAFNPSASNSATKKVMITVSWSSPNPAGSIQLTTLIGATEMAP